MSEFVQPVAVRELPTGTAGTTQTTRTEERPAEWTTELPLETQAPTSPAEPVSLLASAEEDELGIALYYDELADLEVLEQLELLEALAAIEEAEQS